MKHHDVTTRRGFATVFHRPLRLGVVLTAVAVAGISAVVPLSPLAEGIRQWAAGITPAADRGFVLHEIVVEGTVETTREEIIRVLDFHHGAPLLDLDLEDAQQRIKELPWVEYAAINRQLPDRLLVSVEEFVPFARWQIAGKVWLIDRQGNQITRGEPGSWPDLPLFVGEGAAEAASDLLALIGSKPRLASQVVAAVRVADRRWNLQFENGIELRLPAPAQTYGPNEAWLRFADAEQTHRLLDRAIAVLDLRFPDRLIVRVTPDGRAIAEGLEQAT